MKMSFYTPQSKNQNETEKVVSSIVSHRSVICINFAPNVSPQISTSLIQFSDTTVFPDF